MGSQTLTFLIKLRIKWVCRFVFIVKPSPPPFKAEQSLMWRSSIVLSYISRLRIRNVPPPLPDSFRVILKKQQDILRYTSVASLGKNFIKGTLRVHFCSSDKTELSVCAVCECLTFSEIFGDVTILLSCMKCDTNLNTITLQSVTQCWAANAVSTDESRLGHRRQSSANVSVTGNITSCVCIGRCLGI